MLDRSNRLSSSWAFSQTILQYFTISTIKRFVEPNVCNQQPLPPRKETWDIVGVVLPFKDQVSTDINTSHPPFPNTIIACTGRSLNYKDLLRRFVVLRKCRNKFDCLVHEMLFIRHLKPNFNVPSDSICAKTFVIFIFTPKNTCCNLHVTLTMVSWRHRNIGFYRLFLLDV